jgi:hypothetical protein
MGRTFKSVRMGSQEVAARWLGASRALSKEDQIYGQRLAEMVKMHFSEAFYALDGPPGGCDLHHPDRVAEGNRKESSREEEERCGSLTRTIGDL